MDFSKLTVFLDSLEAKYGIPGFDCAIMQNHHLIYRRTAGSRVSENSIFDFYSATKLVTAAAALQLVEQGKLRLDDPVALYLPEYANMRLAENFSPEQRPMRWPAPDAPACPAKNQITIRHLLSMQSGLNYDVFAAPITRIVEISQGQAGTQEIVRALAQCPLLFEPGTDYGYSFGLDVIGAVIEVVSGMSLEQYFLRFVFEPLGITDLYMHVPPEKQDRMAPAYSCDRETGKILPYAGPNVYRFTPRYDSGGAGLSGTVSAYILFLDALACGGTGRNNRSILRPETIHLMASPQLNDKGLHSFRLGGFHTGYSYGCGVRTLIDQSCSQSPLGEFGWDGAAGAYALVDPENHISLFYCQQVLGMIQAFTQIHPQIRDLAYACFAGDTHLASNS